MPVSESVTDATAWALARPCIPAWAFPGSAFPESVFPESALALRLSQPLAALHHRFRVLHSAVHPYLALQQALCPLRCSHTAEACRTIRASSALQAAAIMSSSLCGLLYVLLNCSFLLLPSFVWLNYNSSFQLLQRFSLNNHYICLAAANFYRCPLCDKSIYHAQHLLFVRSNETVRFFHLRRRVSICLTAGPGDTIRVNKREYMILVRRKQIYCSKSADLLRFSKKTSKCTLLIWLCLW